MLRQVRGDPAGAGPGWRGARGGRERGPEAAHATSSSGRSGRGRTRGVTSSVCWTPAKLWLRRKVYRGSSAGGTRGATEGGGARPGRGAGRNFERLLDACEALAAAEGIQVLIAGANMGRHEAYRALLARGFRIEIQGVTMHRPNEPGYNRPGVYIVDDWR